MKTNKPNNLNQTKYIFLVINKHNIECGLGIKFSRLSAARYNVSLCLI